jgi:hypothetical protein
MRVRVLELTGYGSRRDATTLDADESRESLIAMVL